MEAFRALTLTLRRGLSGRDSQRGEAAPTGATASQPDDPADGTALEAKTGGGDGDGSGCGKPKIEVDTERRTVTVDGVPHWSVARWS